MAGTVQARWDTADDWSVFGTTHVNQTTLSRVASPTHPYRGGAGLMESAWTTSSTNFDTYAELDPPGSNRFFSLSLAIRFEQIALGGTVNGPVMFEGVDSDLSSLGVVATMQLGSGVSMSPAGGDSFELDPFFDQWVVYIFRGGSVGSGVYLKPWMTYQALATFGNRLLPLAGGALTIDPDTYRITVARIGFTGLNQTTDSFRLWFDEVECTTRNLRSSHNAMPPSRRSRWQTSV